MRFRVLHIFFVALGLVFQSLLCYGNNLDVIFSSKRGFYDQQFTLSLTCTDPSAVIRYTTDCSVPTMSNGVTYMSGLEITSTTVVKAVAYSSTDTSILQAHTYLFPEDIKKQGKNPVGYPVTWGGSSTIAADYEMDPEIINHSAYAGKIIDAFKSLPALCLSMSIDDWFDPQTGNYVGYPNSDITREKPVSAEFIYTDSAKNFAINCGVQNQGGTSIVNWKIPKQSMRLLFKGIYGPTKLRKKLFPDSEIESINTLVVDGMLYSWVHNFDRTQRVTSLYFRDQLCSDLQNAMGTASFHGIYVNLFINGLYWGIYDLHERPDEDFMEEYFDADKTNFDIVKHDPQTVVAGSNESYLYLLDMARDGFATDESLAEIQKYLDLPAFIDYMILNYYLGNFDWAHQNYYAATNKVSNTGYRFFTWDAEHVMRYSNVDYDNTSRVDIGGPTEIHSYLKENSEYRMMFADAFYKYTFNDGALSIENFEKQFLFRKNEIDLAIILESARWGDYRESIDGVTYTRDDYWIPEVDKVLTEYIPYRRDIVVEQLQRGDNLLYPRTTPPVFSKEEGIVATGESIKIENTNSGASTIVYTVDGTDPRKPGGDIGGSIYKSAIVINDATLIKARVLNSSNDEWSPLAEAYYVPGNIQHDIVISEIMYNSGFNEIEFIELMNSGNKNIDLIGMSFINGIDYTFKQKTILSPGDYIVLTNDMGPFTSHYKFNAFDVYTKRLSNKGETIILVDYFRNVIDSVTYTDTIPWPVLADGNGRSLELIDPELDNALVSSWQASEISFGTPIEYSDISNTPVSSLQVYPNPAVDRVNIVLPDQDYTFDEIFIEVYNNVGQLVKIANFDYLNSTVRLNISNLKPGIYLLRMVDGKGKLRTASTKVIKAE